MFWWSQSVGTGEKAVIMTSQYYVDIGKWSVMIPYPKKLISALSALFSLRVILDEHTCTFMYGLYWKWIYSVLEDGLPFLWGQAIVVSFNVSGWVMPSGSTEGGNKAYIVSSFNEDHKVSIQIFWLSAQKNWKQCLLYF